MNFNPDNLIFFYLIVAILLLSISLLVYSTSANERSKAKIKVPYRLGYDT